MPLCVKLSLCTAVTECIFQNCACSVTSHSWLSGQAPMREEVVGYLKYGRALPIFSEVLPAAQNSQTVGSMSLCHHRYPQAWALRVILPCRIFGIAYLVINTRKHVMTNCARHQICTRCHNSGNIYIDHSELVRQCSQATRSGSNNQVTGFHGSIGQYLTNNPACASNYNDAVLLRFTKANVMLCRSGQ